MEQSWKFEIQLKTLELGNFRGIKALSLAFDPKLTVLIGENGTGKTSVLDALASLLQVFVDKVTHQKTPAKASYITAKDIKNGTLETVNGLHLFIDTRKEGKQLLYLENKLRPKGYSLKTSYQAEELNRIKETIDQITEGYKHNLELPEPTIPLSLPIVAYYPCAVSPNMERPRNGTFRSSTFRTDIITAYDDALSYQSFDFSKFSRWFKWQENIKMQLGKNELLDKVCSAIYEILSDSKNVFSDLRTDWIDNPEGDLLINKGENNPLNIRQFSSGEKSMIALIADLARRLATANPYRANPLEGNGVVLIDEIDLHLHPRWQRAVLPKLMRLFPNIQWVITTHAPMILGEIKTGTVYMLEGAKAKQLKFNTYGKDMNRIFDRIMGVSPRNLDIEARFDAYFELIERQDFETAAAKRKELEELIGTDDPLFLRADGVIKRKQLIGR